MLPSENFWWPGEVEVALFDGVGCVYLLPMYEEYTRLGQRAYMIKIPV